MRAVGMSVANIKWVALSVFSVSGLFIAVSLMGGGSWFVRQEPAAAVEQLPPDPPLLPSPPPAIQSAIVYSNGIDIAVVVDDTSSTLAALLRDFLARVAAAIEQLAGQPGQGRIRVLVVPVVENSRDSRNVLLTFELPPNPPQPERRETPPRPARLTQADIERNCRNVFARSRCIRQLIKNRQQRLQAVLGEEASAVAEYEGQLNRFDEQMFSAAKTAREWVERLVHVKFPPDPACSDVVGALAIAAWSLKALGSASATAIWAQTDAEHNCQSPTIAPAEMDGIDVAFVNWDCRTSCDVRASWLAELLAGAKSVKLMTPAVTALTAIPGVEP